jgi:peptidoglycan/xylan/chitin deacetylase (PgdA/CDA1 family)
MFIFLKSLIAKSFERTGVIARAIRAKSSNMEFLILMYHRVLPPFMVDPTIQRGMYVEPETFRMQMSYLKRKFTVVPLSALRQNGTLHDDSNARRLPVCAITFDDGWFDFFHYAYPVLTELQVPAIVFLPTRYIGTRNWFWADQIARRLVENGPTDTGKHFAKNNGKNAVLGKIQSLRGPVDDRIEKAIALLKQVPHEDIDDLLADWNEPVTGKIDSMGRAFLTWEEVRIMAESGLVSFGSHTGKHKILTHLADDEIMQELTESKETLISEGAADASFLAFSYPNGNYDTRIADLVAQSGYHLAVTTEKGWNSASSPRMQLKRVSIHQDIASSPDLFGCRISGII